MRTPLFAPALSGAILLGASSAHACNGSYETDRHCPTTYGSIGPLFSIAFGERKAFGFGAEFSANYLPDNETVAGYGGYINSVFYFTESPYARLTLGGQANYAIAGGEAGLSYLSGSSGGIDAPPTVGATLGAFSELSILLVAFRTTLPFDGPAHYSLDLGIKIPFVLQGPGFYFPSGRPFRVNGASVVETSHVRSTRDPDASCVDELNYDDAALMADRWLTDGGLEHAAVRAFLALARRLARLGAPASMVRATIAAAAEESRHTAACLDMAARYDGGVRALPRPQLPLDDDRLDDEELRRLVRENWVDGCIGEGLAAEMARARAARCSSARGRELLATIAREERQHAELGFDVLKFLLALEGHRGEVARDEYARLLRHTHAPAFMRFRDPVREAVEGRPDARLGVVFDRTIARGEALRSMCA